MNKRFRGFCFMYVIIIVVIIVVVVVHLPLTFIEGGQTRHRAVGNCNIWKLVIVPKKMKSIWKII